MNGGWLLFLVDACGVWMFGDWWPTVATCCCLVVMLLLVVIALLILHLVSRTWCCRCMGCLCRRCCKRPQAVDLPETPVTQGFQRLVLTGPAGVRAADTEFYQREVRGRGTNQKPNDLVVVMDAGVTRLQLDPERRERIDRHGLWVHPSRVLGATTCRVRELVEGEDQLHLCRGAECQGGVGLHCCSYAAVDAEALVDLGAYDRVTAWGLGVLVWRSLYTACAAVTGLWTALRRHPLSSRPSATRQIQEQGVLRALDPDSESETEVVLNPCEADRIGLVLQGKQRALAPEGCQDRAAPEPTRLLEPDQQLSDLGGKETASLCSHHSQLYMLACQGRKCSVVSCYAAVKGLPDPQPKGISYPH